MDGFIFSLQHKLNPLHVYCRLLDRGMARRDSIRLCRYYETGVYRWVRVLMRWTLCLLILR